MQEEYKFIFDRKSKEYDEYISGEIERLNSNGKKTVLFVCDTYFPTYDGVINVFDMYANALLNAGYNVMAYVPAYKGKVYVKNYPVISAGSFFSKKLNYQVPSPFTGRKTNKYLERLKIDFIHCHSPFFLGRHAVSIHRKRKIKMVTTFHSQYKKDLKKSVKSDLLTNILLKYLMHTFNGSDEVWTVSEACKRIIIDYGYKGKVEIIPNGTDFEASKNYPLEREEAKKLYNTENLPVFLFVGRLVENKNIIFIANVLGYLKKCGLKFKMLFAGDGPDRDKLVKALQNNNVEKETTLLGHISDKKQLASVYSAADLFLFPSDYDTDSIVQKEAASRFLPGVFIENSATSYNVKDKINGFVLPSDEKQFAEGVLEIMNNKPLLKEVSENAFRDLFVRKSRVTEILLKNYERLTGK